MLIRHCQSLPPVKFQLHHGTRPSDILCMLNRSSDGGECAPFHAMTREFTRTESGDNCDHGATLLRLEGEGPDK